MNGDLTFISIISMLIGMISILVTIYKIENKRINKRMIINGILLAFLMLFFHYFIQLTLAKTFPLMSTILSTLQLSIITYILFNLYYKNSVTESIIKTGITFSIGVLTQISVMFLIPVVSLVLPYDSMMTFMSYVAQLWTITFMFWVYPKFSRRIDLIIKDFSEHPKYVFGSLLYFLTNVIFATYARTFLVDNFLLLFIIILFSVSIFIHFVYLLYKYFIKMKKDAVDKDVKLGVIEE